MAKLERTYALSEAWVSGASLICVLQSQASKSTTPIYLTDAKGKLDALTSLYVERRRSREFDSSGSQITLTDDGGSWGQVWSSEDIPRNRRGSQGQAAGGSQLETDKESYHSSLGREARK